MDTLKTQNPKKAYMYKYLNLLMPIPTASISLEKKEKKNAT